jgi:hypothetical protein
VSDLPKLLADRGIKSAIIIDDAYDDVPRPSDVKDEAWTVFFDDLTDAEERALATLYAPYATTEPDELRVSQEFVALLWRERAQTPAAQKLFADYDGTNARERQGLDALLASLKGFGLDCATMGRDLDKDAAGKADVIFADLFLGFIQVEADMTRAVARVSELVRGRELSPPLVVLMSRSTRLAEKRNQFRDEAGLLASGFRVVSKGELEQADVLERLMTRLAGHYEDTRKIASFIQAWDSGLAAAKERFIGILRRLDLPDLAQIRALLLEFEGERLGSYLLDVCDGVLQHEIEADAPTMTAARALNEIDLERYPAPHLVGTADLQELVYRLMFQHPERVLLSHEANHTAVQFGDIIRWRKAAGEAPSSAVSMVITPACDLARGEEQRVLLLSGTLKPLEPARWSYKAMPVRTPIVIIPGDGRYWIQWDLKDIQSIIKSELGHQLEENELGVRIGRLRDMYGIELQQRFLADFGRVGPPANPPATFSVLVSFYYTDVEGKARVLRIDQVDHSVCYVGRDPDSKPVHRLVLTEQACDSVQRSVAALDENAVHQSSRASLRALKGDQAFFASFRVDVPFEGVGSKPIKGAGETIHANVYRNGDLNEGKEIPTNLRKGALLINVIDVPDDRPD